MKFLGILVLFMSFGLLWADLPIVTKKEKTPIQLPLKKEVEKVDETRGEIIVKMMENAEWHENCLVCKGKSGFLMVSDNGMVYYGNGMRVDLTTTEMELISKAFIKERKRIELQEWNKIR